MPYDVPTTDQFYERFPVFADADEDQLAALIVEASKSVDNCWIEADYQPAILYLAAHLLVTDYSQDGAAVVVGPTPGSVQSESFGPMSIAYKDFPGGTLSASETFGSTWYGRRYLALLNANKPPIVVV